jgi:enoyl-CoA hydratase
LSTLPNLVHLRVGVESGVAHVVMDRPPVNAVDQAMYAELRDVFGNLNVHLPEARVVVLSAAGPNFCGGNDLGEFATMDPVNAPFRMRLVRETFAAIYECPVPTIGAVRGAAFGTGLAIAASCDLLVCSETARFGVPEVGVGVMGGARHLARLVPTSTVRLMYLTADPVGAAELERHGGVAAVVPDGELEQRADELAQRIARHSATALRHAKESLNAIEWMDLKSGYEREQQLTARMSGTADGREALRAVIDRTAPDYGNSWTS